MEPSKSTATIRQQSVDEFVDAAHEQPTAAISLLRQNPAIAEATSSWGESGLQAASHLGHQELLSRMIESAVSLDIYAACAIGDAPAVRSMLASSASDAHGIHDLPLLHFGVMSRDIAMLELLLDASVALNPPGASLSPLHSAVAIGSSAMVRLLLSAGASLACPDAFGATALDWALALDRSELVHSLTISRDLRPAPY
jgi:hypothetical protein